MLKNKKILVSGAAGFIGFHISQRLINEKSIVFGFDNLNNYYDVALKKSRIKILNNLSKKVNSKWQFSNSALEDKHQLEKIFNNFMPDVVIHLGAQAGVRYSIENPETYIKSNIVGFSNILECSKNCKIKNLIYASSSSVYGANKKVPFSENDSVDHPVSLYAATKKSNELMAHSYSNLYNLPTTGLRFFTVYGPFGRPDMAPMIFAKSIFEEKPIRIFNNGNMSRDFTYISDITEAIFRCCSKPAVPYKEFNQEEPNPSVSFAPHRIFNIGNGNPVNLLKFIELLELNIGKKAIKTFYPMQPGDVENTYANTSLLRDWIDFQPSISIEEGIMLFSRWFKEYYKY